MSKTITVGVVSVRDRECMAVQAKKALLKITHGELEAKDFPLGVMFEVREFLDSALEEAKHLLYGRIPSNSLVSLNNWNYAVDAFRKSHQFFTGTPVYWDPAVELLVLTQFIYDLGGPQHQLTDEEKEAARKAASFFEQLASLANLLD
jgi:hypothetical protein